LLAALFLASVSWFHGQSSGHWEEVIKIANRELTFDLDLVNNGRAGIGGAAGTYRPGTFSASLSFRPAEVSN
jgi:hypothetical protein